MGYFPTPPRADDQVRRQRDLERSQQEQAAARSLEASSIGAGGLTVKDGGSVRIEDGGDLLVDGDAVFNGSLTVPAGSLNTAGDITAGDDIIAGDVVQGAHVVATTDVSAPVVSAGSASISGDLTAGGQIRMPNVSVTILSTAYFATYASTSDGGRVGHVPSSLEFKDILGDYVVDLEKWIGLAAKARWFVYKDDEQQSPRAGQIAEWVNEDFPEFVIHHEGEPRGIHYEFMITGQISAFAQFVDETRAHLAAQDVEIAELRARLDAAGL